MHREILVKMMCDKEQNAVRKERAEKREKISIENPYAYTAVRMIMIS